MKIRLLYGLSFMFLGIVFCGCAGTPVMILERGDKDAAKRVLIATEQSEFKEAVTSRIMDTLEQEGCFVRLIGLENLADESVGHYGAIVIINSYEFWQIDWDASDFIDSVDEKAQEKIILLTTVGGTLQEQIFNPGRGNVDSISSASVMSKADSISGEIIEKIQVLLELFPSEPASEDQKTLFDVGGRLCSNVSVDSFQTGSKGLLIH